MKKLIETKANEYRSIQLDGPCLSKSSIKRSDEPDVASSTSERHKLRAVVDSDGYLHVVPQGHKHSGDHPITQLPKGATLIEWGPCQHGITLCIVVRNVGFIIIRHPGNGETFLVKGPSADGWYEDRVSTVDCDSIDFDNGHFISESQHRKPMSTSIASRCFYQDKPFKDQNREEGRREGSSQIVGGRASATIVGAAFSPYSTDLIVFFEGKPMYLRRPEHSSVALSGCRAVMFSRGGTSEGNHSNTWTIVKKTSRLLREITRTEECTVVSNQANSEGVPDAPMIRERQPLRRRRATPGSSSQSSVNFCAAAWHPKFQIESANFNYDLGVVKKSKETDERKPSSDVDSQQSACESSQTGGEGCDESECADLNEYITTVTTTHSETLLPMSVLAVAGSDSTVRLIDMASMMSGGGGEILTIDMSEFLAKSSDKIVSISWGPRWGSHSPLVIVTNKCFSIVQVSFNASSMTVTSTPLKRKSAVPRRRPHTYIWASVGSPATHWFRSLQAPYIHPIAVSDGQRKSMQSTQEQHFSQDSSGVEGTGSVVESAHTGIKSQSESLRKRPLSQLLQTQALVFAGNPLIQLGTQNDGQPKIVSGPTPTHQGVTWRIEKSTIIYTVATTDGPLRLASNVIFSSISSVDQFPMPPDVARLVEWNDFLTQYSVDSKVIISFIKSACRRRTAATADSNKVEISLSRQQVKETYRALSKILELSESPPPDRNATQPIDDKVFGFLVKTCRRITSVDKEVASTVHSGMPVDIHTTVKIFCNGTIDVTTRETFQTSKSTTTKRQNFALPQNLTVHSLTGD